MEREVMMKKEQTTRGNYNSTLLIRIEKKEKDKLFEVAKYYGMRDVSSLLRKLISNTIEKYEENVGK